MQHTFLSSIALAGGCYGVLTTIYMLLFGMTRITPWGIVHHIPVFIKKYTHHIKSDKQQNEEDAAAIDEEGFDVKSAKTTDTTTRKSTEYLDTDSVPWFFRNKALKTTDDIGLEDVFTRQDKSRPDELQLLDNKTDRNSQYSEPQSPTIARLPPYPTAGNNSEIFLARVSEALCREQQRADALQEKTTLLSDRVVELEFILTEYFIDTNYG